jgi:hypothetical protein
VVDYLLFKCKALSACSSHTKGRKKERKEERKKERKKKPSKHLFTVCFVPGTASNTLKVI